MKFIVIPGTIKENLVYLIPGSIINTNSETQLRLFSGPAKLSNFIEN